MRQSVTSGKFSRSMFFARFCVCGGALTFRQGRAINLCSEKWLFANYSLTTKVCMNFRRSGGRPATLLAILFLSGFFGNSPAVAAPQQSTDVGASGLPIPRFVSVSAEKANLRKGPGRKYPIAWVYLRRGLPLEVIGEYEHWRKVRDRTGETGWIHRTLLTGQRKALVVAVDSQTPVAFFDAPSLSAQPGFYAETGAIGDVVRCTGEWCEIAFDDLDGWVSRGFLWGVYPQEVID
ncbi:MAG TPA: hypothetical protein DDW95_14985 [Alphaproteobacteria bacterium]|nr:hypothetical protein [Alphaproteobacteria bacterium]HBC54119.1 hypothetical protein [Alphaproteobacteria bacterium]HBF99846.1 hypothetical protein [Alphaproteobacteria bacterium]HCO92139.1 hypothetical protein [Alphaproteobacteria bacterium]